MQHFMLVGQMHGQHSELQKKYMQMMNQKKNTVECLVKENLTQHMHNIL